MKLKGIITQIRQISEYAEVSIMFDDPDSDEWRITLPLSKARRLSVCSKVTITLKQEALCANDN